MSWKVVKVSSFLSARKERYKPDDKAIQGLQRIEKIDFLGNIFLSDKPSKTDMILIKQRDLVISGINVAKGAMSIYKGKEDVVATIHYSSYEYNLDKIDLDFLRHFLKSSEFIEALKEQVPGGIKTEIKPKHILPLRVCIPTKVEKQREIVKFLDKQNNTIETLSTELTNQLSLVKQLRQSFLREAMQGKLVAQNPNDEPASVLLEKIKSEKNKWIRDKVIKRPKPIPPILDYEIPFDIPPSWTWCRLGEFAYITSGSTPNGSAFVSQGIPFLKMYNLRGQKVDFDYKRQFIKEDVHNGSLKRCRAFPGDLIMNIVGPPLGKLAIIPRNLFECNFNQAAVLIRPPALEINKYLFWYLSEMSEIKEVETKGVAGQNNISVTQAHNMKIPLPPLSEQQRIVSKLDDLMAYCDSLEESIKNSQELNKKLLGQVLREALEPEGKVVDV